MKYFLLSFLSVMMLQLYPNELITYFTGKIDEDPMFAYYYQERAKVYHQFKMFDLALKDIDTYLEKEPDARHAMELKAQIYFQKNQFDLAENTILKISKKKNHWHYSILARFIIELDITNEAQRQKSLEYALAAYEASDKKKQHVLITLAQNYLINNQTENGMDILQKIIKEEPDNHYCHIMLANFFTLKGDYEKSMEILKKHIRRSVDLESHCKNHIAYQLVSYSNHALHKPLEALKLAQEASNETKQKYEDIEDTLAMAHFRNKNYLLALEAQERALKLLEERYPKEKRKNMFRSSKYHVFYYQKETFKNNLMKPNLEQKSE